MKKKLGMALVVIGFLGGAFLSALDPQIMKWNWYVLALGIGVFGLFIYKKALLSLSKSAHILEGNKKDLETSLKNIIKNLKDLNLRKNNVGVHDMRHEIDKLFPQDLNKFVEARESLKHIYSIQAYADIMSAFAAGERYLNRVWSASADGYVDEAMEYVGRALDQFIHAQKELKKAGT